MSYLRKLSDFVLSKAETFLFNSITVIVAKITVVVVILLQRTSFDVKKFIFLSSLAMNC